MLFPLEDQLRVQRPGSSTSRTRPAALLGDKAYAPRANLAYLRNRRIEAVIPVPNDQQGHRIRRGSKGGRLPKFDAEKYQGRNDIERGYGRL